LQASALTDANARAALEDTQRRIGAIAQVHRRLYSANDVESVDMREYLGALVAELATTLSGESGGHSLLCAADALRLPTDRAVSVGVIVTELVTNACKYAYPDGNGDVRVLLKQDGEGSFLLAVEDDGCGMPEGVAPKGTGLGTKLIRVMAQSLQSAVNYEPREAGVRATLRASLA
ncbi:sensor histidine kinase, partial [Sphingomonas sp.]|uniref:sensor histidine kinase n=2 Tax=Sphingomonas TaxID=13687 RepID=UPI002D7F1794